MPLCWQVYRHDAPAQGDRIIRQQCLLDPYATALVSRLCDSEDLYPQSGKQALNSINYLTCHAGFTLNDLVSYAHKHSRKRYTLLTKEKFYSAADVTWFDCNGVTADWCASDRSLGCHLHPYGDKDELCLLFNAGDQDLVFTLPQSLQGAVAWNHALWRCCPCRAESEKGYCMNSNPLLRIKELGQSIWLDYIQRELLASGEFQQMIDDDGVCGVTSNPAILEKAIAEHHDYDAAIKAMQGADEYALYERLAIEDLQQAADLLGPIYDSTQGRDGFVSFEVSPLLADDTEATVREAKRLWTALDRPNSLIKVPATAAGLLAIEQLIGEGINVNATLLFSLQRYQQVAEAYIVGLETRAARGDALTSVASVASFFLSRIDTLVDSRLDALAQGPLQHNAQALRGHAAIASAQLAYQHYKQRFSGERWQALVAAGARTQRLLWASTSTKDPAYRDIKYVDALIGTETINTLPLETVAAYRDHGQPAARLEHDIARAHHYLSGLAGLGIELGALTDQLEKEGVEKFTAAFSALLKNLRRRIA